MRLFRWKDFDDRLVGDGCSGLRGGSVSWWRRVSGMGVNGDMVRNDVYLDFRRLLDGGRGEKRLWRRGHGLSDRGRHRLSGRRRWRDRRCSRGLKGDRDGRMEASSASVSRRCSERDPGKRSISNRVTERQRRQAELLDVRHRRECLASVDEEISWRGTHRCFPVP